MARQREFDRDDVIRKAMGVFWQKGFAATSTDDLLAAMGIGRQSMYNTFGDKRSLYLEVLRAYQGSAIAGHVARLTAPASPLDGVRDLLAGLAMEDDAERALGCLGVGSVGEFGVRDAEVAGIRNRENRVLEQALAERMQEARARGEVPADVDVPSAVGFVVTTMTGLQVAARAGVPAADMRARADFAVSRLAA